jgi:hypothetical protein
MKNMTHKRTRWDQMKHLYVLTTPDSLIFSYKTLSNTNKLERVILEMINPIESDNDTILLEFINKEYKKYKLKNGSLQYPNLPKKFFLEKLLTVSDNNDLEAFSIATNTFDNNKGYEITLGKSLLF